MLMVILLILMQVMPLLIRLELKKTTGETGDDGTKNVEVSFAELLKCL